MEYFVPSSPSRLNLSTRFFAVSTKFAVKTGSAATAAKFSLPAPPPPIERMTFSCGYCRFDWVNALMQPFAPSTGICSSAHSSLNYGWIRLIFLPIISVNVINRGKGATDVYCAIWLDPIYQNTRQHMSSLVSLGPSIRNYPMAGNMLRDHIQGVMRGRPQM